MASENNVEVLLKLKPRRFSNYLNSQHTQLLANTVIDNFVVVDNVQKEKVKQQPRDLVLEAIQLQKKINQNTSSNSSSQSEYYRKTSLYYQASIKYYEAATFYCQLNGAKNTELAIKAKDLGYLMFGKAQEYRSNLTPYNLHKLEVESGLMDQHDTVYTRAYMAILNKTAQDEREQAEREQDKRERAQTAKEAENTTAEGFVLVDKTTEERAQIMADKAKSFATTDQTGGFGKTIRSRSRKHNKNKKRTSNKKRASKKRS